MYDGQSPGNRGAGGRNGSSLPGRSASNVFKPVGVHCSQKPARALTAAFRRPTPRALSLPSASLRRPPAVRAGFAMVRVGRMVQQTRKEPLRDSSSYLRP